MGPGVPKPSPPLLCLGQNQPRGVLELMPCVSQGPLDNIPGIAQSPGIQEGARRQACLDSVAKVTTHVDTMYISLTSEPGVIRSSVQEGTSLFLK